MKRLQTLAVLLGSILTAGLWACHSSQDSRKSTPDIDQNSRGGVASNNPPSANPTDRSGPTEASVQPPRQPDSEQPLLDQDSTAGVRGSRTVTFVVLDGGKPVQAADVTIIDAKGKVEAEQNSDDWGEFKPTLGYGKYKVKATWKGESTQQTVRVDDKTPEIDLKLAPPPS